TLATNATIQNMATVMRLHLKLLCLLNVFG
ncbi:MAG: hypothetical protein RLZZ367_2060, partial [Bacteroidota bacterium]